MNSSHATKSFVLILLVAILCAERAQGLKCYSCLGVPPETSCPSVTCPYSDGYCVTQKVEFALDSLRRKLKNSQCLRICPIDHEDLSVFTINTTTICCQKDLCNGAVPTGGSTWTMAGVLLFSLASVLLQTLL